MSPGVVKLLAFGLPVLGFLVWQIVSVSRELEDEDDSES